MSLSDSYFLSVRACKFFFGGEPEIFSSYGKVVRGRRILKNFRLGVCGIRRFRRNQRWKDFAKVSRMGRRLEVNMWLDFG